MLRNRNSEEEVKLRAALRRYRKLRGISQVELAKMCELPQSFISKYETGERYLTFVEVLTLCKLLDIDIDKLVEELGEELNEEQSH